MRRLPIQLSASTLAIALALGVVVYGRFPKLLAACTIPDATPPRVQLRLVTANLTQPVYLTHAGDSSGRLFIVEQGGTIRIFKGGKGGGGLLPTPFLTSAPRSFLGASRDCSVWRSTPAMPQTGAFS